MRVNVLGTPTVSIGGQRTEVSGPLQRLLLCLLAARPDGWSPAAALVDALWPDEVGDRLEARLQLHIHRLRGRLGADAVLSGPGGYRLGLDASEVDAWQFDTLVANALTAHRSPLDGTDLLPPLEEGLALWGGEPFSGLEHPSLQAERHRLTELYLLGQETRIQHRLDRGHHEVARAVVMPLATSNPLRERLQALWMTALHRAGEQGAALEVYRNTRRRLVDELGIEPGSELQGIQELVLSGDPLAIGATPRKGPPQASELPVRECFAAAADAYKSVRQLCRSGSYTEAEKLLRESIEEQPAPRLKALGRRELGVIVSILGRQTEALDLQSRAETYFHQHGDVASQVCLLEDMAVVCALTGDLHRSHRVLGEADALRRAAGMANTESDVVRANLLVHMRSLDEAAAVLARLEGIPLDGEPAITLARANSQLRRRRGEHSSGIEWAERALGLASRGESHQQLGLVLVDLGSCLRDAGDDRCFEAYEEAIQLARGTGRSPLAAMTHAAVAKAWLRWDDPGRATVQAREALRLATSVESWGFAGRANARLGDAADALSEPIRASWYWQEALACWRRVDYPVPPEERGRVEFLVEARAVSVATS